MRGVLAGEHESSPRESATDHIRPHDGPEGPLLQVGSLQRFIQEDAVSGLPQAIPKLNVFNGRTREAFLTEPARSQKYGAPHGPTSGPESGSFRITVLVYEVMQQVTVLRNHARDARSGVIRAEDCSHIRLRIKDLENTS